MQIAGSFSACPLGITDGIDEPQDAVLTEILLKAGGQSLYTRNTKDFEGYAFISLLNTIDA